MPKKELRILDSVSSDPCIVCGYKGYIVDGFAGKYWLLCLGLDCACVECKPIPDDIIIVED